MAGTRITNLGGIAAAIARFRTPPNSIRGLSTADWMGPLQPVRPIAPPGTQPRGWQYYPGQNLIYTPRAEERLTAERLRQLSLYPIARIVIENVKDQIVAKGWKVRLRTIPGETAAERRARRKSQDREIGRLQQLLECPNPDEDWRDWLRPLLDDAMVIDAPAVLVRRNAQGAIVELRHSDGALITRYIEEHGWTPEAPSPAYAQLWYGVPAVDLTAKQLLYRPRNVRSYKFYGMSPTESVSDIIMTGIERLNFRRAYYAEGSVPGAMMIVPPGVAPDQIREAQDWLNSDLAGQLAKRRQLRLIQGFNAEGKDQILFPKEPLLKDDYDDYEISVLCYAYGAARQRLIKQLSRGAAKQSQDAAEEEGLEPWLDWVEGLCNRILREASGSRDFEFVFSGFRETDVQKQAQADASDIKSGIRTINEVREDRGYEPRSEPDANKLGVLTPTGFVLLGATANGSSGGSDGRGPAAPRSETPGATINGDTTGRRAGDPSAPATASSAARERDHAAKKALTASRSPVGVAAAAIAAWLHAAGRAIAASLGAAAKKADSSKEKVKHDAEDILILLAALRGQSWQRLSGLIEPLLIEKFMDGAGDVPGAREAAAEYAVSRASEIVSLDEQARWSVARATYNALNATGTRAGSEGWGAGRLQEEIAGMHEFSSGRAQTIAENEGHMAFEAGVLFALQKRGAKRKRWVLSPLHVVADECDANAFAGPIPLDKEFPTGVTAPPTHPNCRCHLEEAPDEPTAEVL